MSVFLLPSWLIQRIDQIRKRFLWGNNEAGKNKIHLMAWSRLCLPKKVGGLGLKDLGLQNRALLLRWHWMLYSDTDSLWFKLAQVLYSPPSGCSSPLLWNKTGSFFWKGLCSLRYLFQLSSRVSVASGSNSSFWFDNWWGRPLIPLTKHQQKVPRPKICFRNALPVLNQLLPRPRELHLDTILSTPLISLDSTAPDSISWFWSSSGSFSVSSTYEALATAGKTSSDFGCIWKLKVPPSLKLFVFLLCNNRLLTKQQLSRRGMHVTPGCVLCQNAPLEDTLHLFFNCTFISNLWNRMQLYFQLPNLTPAPSIRDSMASLLACITSNQAHGTVACTTFWVVWLERNNRIFRNTSKPVEVIALWVAEESRNYTNFS